MKWLLCLWHTLRNKRIGGIASKLAPPILPFLICFANKPFHYVIRGSLGSPVARYRCSKRTGGSRCAVRKCIRLGRWMFPTETAVRGGSGPEVVPVSRFKPGRWRFPEPARAGRIEIVTFALYSVDLVTIILCHLSKSILFVSFSFLYSCIVTNFSPRRRNSFHFVT